jgi:hypothetical protein
MNRGDVILVRIPHPSGVVSCLLLATIDTDRVDSVLGKLSTAMLQHLNDCLKAALDLG